MDKFREAFKDFAENYVIIGGAACDIREELGAQVPRATKDIDVILVVEALSRDFVAHFWNFILEAGYTEKEMGEKGIEIKHQYYRFRNPSNISYPYQVELFSRIPDMIELPADFHITPIPTDDDLSSLSAILMDDDYYNFTINNSSVEDGVHIANAASLIALKCKALLEMTRAKERGEGGDSKHINKHKNDVFRILATLPMDSSFAAPETIRTDVSDFCEAIKDNLPTAELFKAAKIRNADAGSLWLILQKLFAETI